MRVDADHICEHGMPQPWATCTECMLLPGDLRPEPPPPPPVERAGRRARPGAMPATADDPIPDLVGDRDVSFPVHAIDEHIEGDDNDWVFGDHGFPWGLRPGGWLYLRCDGWLRARARVRGIGFREVRLEHTTDDPDGRRADWGPGSTIELDPATWQRCDIDLGELAESQRQGYRYLITHADGQITHLMASDELPVNIGIDPPADT